MRVLVFLVLAFQLSAATRFWVGSGSTTAWNATANTNWSASTGGANNASVPTTGDTVIFDANSGAGPAVVTANTANVLTLTFTGYTGNLTINTGTHIGFTSALTLASTMTLTCNGTGFFDQLGTTTSTITTGTIQMCGLTNGGTGTLTLQDAYVSATGSNITITAGQIQFNAKTVTTSDLVSSGATTRTLDLTNVTLNLNSTGTILSFTGSGLTFTPTGSTINITDTSSTGKTFAGGGSTFAALTTSGGTGVVTFTGANTFTTFTPAAASFITLPASTTTTVTTFVGAGSAGNLITLKSSSAGTQTTLSQASGTVNATYLSLKDMVATSGATFNCANCTSVSNNTGWSFGFATSAGAFAIQ